MPHDNDRASPPAARIPVTLLTWRPLVRGSLRGFAKLRLGRALIVNDCPAHLSHGRKWVALPAKPQLTRERELIRDGTGKLQYAAVLEWADRAAADAFNAAAINAIEAQYPDAFDAGAAS